MPSTQVVKQIVNEVTTELGKVSFDQGVRAAELVNEMLKDGSVKPGGIVHFPLSISEYTPKRYFSDKQRAFIAIKDFLDIQGEAVFEFSNYGIGAVSALTAGRSAIQFIYCTNPAARRFYAMSVAFSSVATTSGCMAGYARVCSLSRTAMATETIGFIFMRLGDMTLNAAKAAEGNRKIFQQRQGRRWGYSGSGVSFVVPPACNYRLSSVIEKIPFQRIGQVVGFTISVYFYGKLLFRVYGYGKQIRGKSQSRYRTLNVRKASIQLIRSFNSCTQVSRIFAVYKLAIS